jgi:predicted transposase YbfD/YdcC
MPSTRRPVPGPRSAPRQVPGGRRVVAVDGKTLRGSSTAVQPGRHLLAALDHCCGVVLGQVDVEAKTNEIPMFAPLLDRIDLAGAVVTADALHAQRAHAEYLTGRGAHYLITVKGNQPGLHAQLAALPWRQVPAACRTREQGHGRAERRTLKVTAAAAGLAAIARGHWLIEDQLHWVRDMDWDEDRSQVRTGNGPRVMASLRNLAITILRLTGETSIAALRYQARRPGRPLQTIMNC